MRSKLMLFAASVAIVCAVLGLGRSVVAQGSPKRIEVTSSKFAFTPGELTLKKGQPVVLVLKSADVAHGLRFKELNVDIKVSKGGTAEVQFTPDKTGDFVGHCSVFLWVRAWVDGIDLACGGIVMRRMVGAILLVALGLCGCKADPPGKLEHRVVTVAKHKIFIRNKKQKNPLMADVATIADGKEAFTHYCVACHGMDGQNTGVPFAEHMSPPIPSLASEEVQGYTDGQLKWVIDNGIWPSGMPGSKGTLSDDEIWSIVVFLRHLPPAGSQGDPEM